MQEFIIDFINRFGYFGIAFLIAVENLFPPIPSEIILTFSGFITLHSDLKIIPIIIVSTIGSLIGAVILYFIGRLLHADRLKKILSGKTGKILRLKPDDVERANNWFSRHGKKTVFFCRFIPIIRSLISIPAGITKMRFYIFLPLTLLGSLIWNSVLILLGKFAGEMWSLVASYFDLYSTIALIVILLIILILAVVFIKHRFLPKKSTAPEIPETTPEAAETPSDVTETLPDTISESESTVPTIPE